MAQVKTNNISLQIAVEASLGVLPGSPVWYTLEPNDIGDFGATITTVAREPISASRQRRKGTTTDLDSAVSFEHDLTKDVFILLSEGFVFATYSGNQIARPTANDTDSYTVAAGPTLAQDTLIYVRGAANAANNGLKEVAAGATTTDIPVESPALVAETYSPVNTVSIEVCGRRFPTSDLSITVSGGVATIVSAAVNLTTIGVSVGQLIHVGGLLVANQFSAGAGYARVRTISTTTITADKLSSTLATDPGTGDTVDLLFGLFLRNVPTTHGSYITRSYNLELALPNLDVAGSPTNTWMYAVGNLANEMAISLTVADKALVEFGFVGTDTQTPTTSRATNAATPLPPIQTTAFNSSSDVLRLRVQQTDGDGLTTCFKDVTLTLGNGVTPEKCIGTLGAVFMNVANFTVDLEGEILFTSKEVADAVRNNETVTMDTLLKNSDGAISIDIPSLTLGDGAPGFPINESVTMSLSGQAFQDSFFGTSIGISTFPVVP